MIDSDSGSSTNATSSVFSRPNLNTAQASEEFQSSLLLNAASVASALQDSAAASKRKATRKRSTTDRPVKRYPRKRRFVPSLATSHVSTRLTTSSSKSHVSVRNSNRAHHDVASNATAAEAAALSAVVAANTAHISAPRAWKEFEMTLVNVKEEDDASSGMHPIVPPSAPSSAGRTECLSPDSFEVVPSVPGRSFNGDEPVGMTSSSLTGLPTSLTSPIASDVLASVELPFEEDLMAFPVDEVTVAEVEEVEEEEENGAREEELEEGRKKNTLHFDEKPRISVEDNLTRATPSSPTVDLLTEGEDEEEEDEEEAERPNASPLPIISQSYPGDQPSAASSHVAQEGRVFFYKSSVGKYPMATWKNYSYAFTQIKRRGDGAFHRVIYRCKHSDVCRGRIHVDLDRKCVVKSLPHNFDTTPPDFETFCK